jgi:hypothetical protein
MRALIGWIVVSIIGFASTAFGTTTTFDATNLGSTRWQYS